MCPHFQLTLFSQVFSWKKACGLALFARCDWQFWPFRACDVTVHLSVLIHGHPTITWGMGAAASCCWRWRRIAMYAGAGNAVTATASQRNAEADDDCVTRRILCKDEIVTRDVIRVFQGATVDWINMHTIFWILRCKCSKFSTKCPLRSVEQTWGYITDRGWNLVSNDIIA